MILKSIDQRIRSAFSNSAVQYDVLTAMHKEIGRELVEGIKDIHTPSRILDVGMGTGYLTNRLKAYFPQASIIGIDPAEGMVATARQKSDGFSILQADARALPFKDRSFDLIASNLALQWVDDLDSAIIDISRCLKKEGMFVFTVFGFDTFQELFDAIKQAQCLKENFTIRRLPHGNKLISALTQADLKPVDLRREIITTHFPDMLSLIRWIKDIGANQLERNFFVGPELLERAHLIYQEKYTERAGVRVTFEVLWGKALKHG